MLPPPLSRTTMDGNWNTTEQGHHQSDIFFNTSIHSTLSTNSLPTVPFNISSSVKRFLSKTLAKVAATNLSDYTSVYSPPSVNTAAVAASSLPNSSFQFNRTTAEVYAGLIAPQTARGDSGAITEIPNGFDGYAVAADMAASSLSNGSHHLEPTSACPTAQTVATFIAGNKNRASTIIVYPTVAPESIVIPIVSCIFGFPILAFIVICCLRHRAKLARERDRRRNYDMQDHAVSLVRFSPIHRLNYRSTRAISLRPERSLSQGFTSLELDTVVEERCSDVEQTQTEILNAESPMESSTTSCKISFSSS